MSDPRVTLCYQSNENSDKAMIKTLTFEIKEMCLLWAFQFVEKGHNPYLQCH